MTKKRTVIVKARGGTMPPKHATKKAAKQVTRLGTALRTLGGLGGGALGGYFGNPVAGSTVGTSLGAALSRWLGAGDYTVESNSIVKQSLRASASIPMMHNENQSVVIRHREYLGEILSSTTFSVLNTFEINPGSSRTFPWLSTVASSFQEYKFKGLVFHYIPTSGSAVSGTSPSLGSVMLQTSYRSTDAAPTNKVEMLNEYCSNEVVPSETMAHPIECDPKENPFNVLYVRTGDIPSGDTKMMYDLGLTHVAVSGQLAAGNVIGDLWVTYEVELKKPLIASNVTSSSLAGSLDVTGTMTGNTLFSGTKTQFGTMTISSTGNAFYLPKGSVGTWLVCVHLKPTTNFTAVSWAGPTFADCTGGIAINASGDTIYSSTVAGTSPTAADCFIVFAIRVTSPTVQPYVTLATPTLGGTVSDTTVLVTPFSARF